LHEITIIIIIIIINNAFFLLKKREKTSTQKLNLKENDLSSVVSILRRAFLDLFSPLAPSRGGPLFQQSLAPWALHYPKNCSKIEN